MENDLNKHDGLYKEILSKINSILEIVEKEYKISLIDPHNLEEIRKLVKVKEIYFYTLANS
jgi:hypothetical protein